MSTQQYKAVTPDGWEIKPGDSLVDFRGQEWWYTGCYHERKIIVSENKDDVNDPRSTREFYPSVFNLKVVPA